MPGSKEVFDPEGSQILDGVLELREIGRSFDRALDKGKPFRRISKRYKRQVDKLILALNNLSKNHV